MDWYGSYYGPWYGTYYGGDAVIPDAGGGGGGGGRLLWTDLPIGRPRRKSTTDRPKTRTKTKRATKKIELRPDLIEPKPKPARKPATKRTRKPIWTPLETDRPQITRVRYSVRIVWAAQSNMEALMQAEEDDFNREQDDMQAIKMLLELI
jgi:hypothetical protein